MPLSLSVRSHWTRARRTPAWAVWPVRRNRMSRFRGGGFEVRSCRLCPAVFGLTLGVTVNVTAVATSGLGSDLSVFFLSVGAQKWRLGLLYLHRPPRYVEVFIVFLLFTYLVSKIEWRESAPTSQAKVEL